MFTCCGNNPVIQTDPSGHLSLDICPVAFACSNNGAIYAPDDAYSKDSGIINGQGIFKYANESFGFGTYASSGCAVIAVYNAMQLLGHQKALGSIADDFLISHGTLLFGAAGVAPWDIDDFFLANDMECVGYSSYSALLNDVSEGDVIVFTVINNVDNIFDGFHTMAAQYTNGQFIVYNRYNNRDCAYSLSSLESTASNSGWIYGYIVGG